MVLREPRLAVRSHRKVVVVLAVSIALALSGLGIESASASTRSRLAVSLKADRSSATRLDGSTVRGKIYVFVRNSTTLDKVDFYLDSARRTKQPPLATDKQAPFDFAGTAADGTSRTYDTSKLADGSHTIRAVMTWADGTTSTRRGHFKVHNGGVKPAPSPSPTATTTAPEPAATTTAPEPAATTTKPATTTAPAPPPRTTAPPTTSAPTATATGTSTPTTTGTSTSGPWDCTFIGDNSCGPFDYPEIVNSNGYNTYVNSDCWGHPNCGYKVEANKPGDWQVTGAEPDGNTAVMTYPHAKQLFNNWCSGGGWGCDSDTPVSGLASLTSTYAETMNETSKTNAQAAWDIWTSSGELMVWVDTTALRGSGGAEERGSGTLSGHPFTFYVYGGDLPIIKLDTNQKSGTIDLLAALRYFQSQGFLAADATITQVNFGWEVCSTGGAPETFRITDYSLNGAAN